MKILQIHTELYGGGIESFVVSLSNQLNQMGQDVSLCSIFEPRGGCWNKISPNIHTFTLHKSKQGFSLFFPLKIHKMLHNSNFEVVHMHGFIAYYAIAILLLHRRIRFIYTIHNRADKEGSQWDQRLLPLKKFFFKHWVKAVTISEESSLSFHALYKNCEFEQITNGITLPQNTNTQNHEDWQFIHLGRICIQKNQLILCDAFRKFLQCYPEAKLTIAGEVWDEQIYTKLQTYFDPNIEYIGFVSNINERLSRAGALCLPSLWEGMPIVLLEAMANGCIPICSPVGGIKNVIQDGVNGILSKGCSTPEYLNALSRYGQMTIDERNAIRQRCIQTAKEMDISKTAAHYLQLFQHLTK